MNKSNTEQKRSADGRFATDLSSMRKLAEKKIPKNHRIPEGIEYLAFPKPEVDNPLNLDTFYDASGKALSITELMRSATSETTNDDEREYVGQQRKMLENLFGAIDWTK